MKSKLSSLFFLALAAATLTGCNTDKGAEEENKKKIAESEEVSAENLDEFEDSIEFEETNNNKLSIGESYMRDGLSVTLNEVRYVTGGEYDENKNGKFIAVNVSVVNNTNKEFNISSLLNFELKDPDGYPYSPTLLLEGKKPSVDGAVEIGETLRGEIVYDVPDAEHYDFHYSEIFAKGKGKWKIPSDQILNETTNETTKETTKETNNSESSNKKEN